MKETQTIKAMFDNIAERYDFLNHLLSFFQDFYWRHVMNSELLPAADVIVLDLATGTGDSAKGAIKRGFRVVGVDLSYKMLYKTKKKVLSKNFTAVAASGYQLPYKDESFGAVTCAFGIRNMHETVSALKEINRVIKRGGKAIFLEFTMPEAPFKYVYRLYLKYFMPAIASLFSKKDAYDYLWQSIENFPNPDVFSELLKEAGFSAAKKKALSFGCVYVITAYKL